MMNFSLLPGHSPGMHLQTRPADDGNVARCMPNSCGEWPLKMLEKLYKLVTYAAVTKLTQLHRESS